MPDEPATSSDVEDAVQETLFILHRRLGGLRRVESISAWLFTVVRRECLRMARRVSPTMVEITSAQSEEQLITRPEPEFRLMLAAAIESLPPRYREVVLLRDIEEMTIDEIGSALGVTRESVKARLHRARALLREYLLR